MKQKGDNRAKQEACHQNQLLRLSTALTVVATRGMWPYMAANVLRHLDLCKPWPFKLLMPLDPISNILPVVITRARMWARGSWVLMRPMTGWIAYEPSRYAHVLLCFCGQLLCVSRLMSNQPFLVSFNTLLCKVLSSSSNTMSNDPEERSRWKFQTSYRNLLLYQSRVHASRLGGFRKLLNWKWLDLLLSFNTVR